MNWEKLDPNLSFANENKVSNLNKTAPTSNTMNEVFYYLKF